MSMSLRENITAVIETCFSETKEEIQETAISRILELIRADEPNSSEKPNNCEPQTYITEDRDTQILDAWQVHHRNTTSVEDEPQTERRSLMPDETEHTCQFCYYEYFDSRAYPCSMCVCGEERKDMFQPKGRQSKRKEKQTDCPWKRGRQCIRNLLRCWCRTECARSANALI